MEYMAALPHTGPLNRLLSPEVGEITIRSPVTFPLIELVYLKFVISLLHSVQ